MKLNRMKAKLKQGSVVIGTFVFGCDPAIPEILGGLGYDFVILDMEHSAKDWPGLEGLIRATELGGATPIVRLPGIDPARIGLALDLGAQGILVPHVRSVADARAFAEALRYPPIGSRGACSGVRATRYFIDDWMEHQTASNRHVLGIAMIEDASAVESAGEIAAVDGIDAICIGKVDLGASMGLNGLGDNVALSDAIDKVVERSLKGGADVAMVVYDTSETSRCLKKGSRIIIYSQDFKVMAAAYKSAIDGVKAVLGSA